MKNKEKYEKMVYETLEDFFKHIHELYIKEVLDKAAEYRKSVNILFTEEKNK